MIDFPVLVGLAFIGLVVAVFLGLVALSWLVSILLGLIVLLDGFLKVVARFNRPIVLQWGVR